MSPPASSGTEVNCDRQFVAIVSEKQAIVVALPSHNVVYKHQITETAFVVKAEIISLKGK
jgi:syntaxin-binding protein 5